MPMNRRDLLGAAAAAAAVSSLPSFAFAADDRAKVYAEIDKRHGEAVARLQEWVRNPTIAAEGRGVDIGVGRMIDLLRDAGFQTAVKMPTSGVPGVFATLDAGAPKTVGLYFMYDVKQADPAEWTTAPPFEAKIIDKAGFGKVLVGRGAVNQKGPEAAFLAALHAFKGAGVKPPVNLVLVAEGEEEIGSPHFKEVVRKPEVAAALSKTMGVYMPGAGQDPDGSVQVSLGAKGVVECELVSSGAKWGRGPTKDVHSANRARLDSPAFHLVQALATLVTADGDPAIEGLTTAAKPPSPAQAAMLDEAAKRLDEATAKKMLGATRWAHGDSWRASLERLTFSPTVNIEGLVGGYTGPAERRCCRTRPSRSWTCASYRT